MAMRERTMSFLEGCIFKDTMPLSADERDFNHCAHYVHITKRGSGWVAIVIVEDCVSDNAYCQKTVGRINFKKNTGCVLTWNAWPLAFGWAWKTTCGNSMSWQPKPGAIRGIRVFLVCV